MNNLVESVRYGLKYLLNNEENLQNHDLLNNLLQVKYPVFCFRKIKNLCCFFVNSESSKIECNLCKKYSINEM